MNIALWIIAGLLAAAFLASGIVKLIQPKEKLVSSGFGWAEDFSTGALKAIGTVDTALGRSYVSELGRFLDGNSHQNYAIYHDLYERTPDGWKFAQRVYEIKYHDATPLAGSPGPWRGAGADAS